MGEVIVVTSGKGGVGKTTVVANLGVGLVKNGKSVLVVDMDIGLRNLDLMIGMENQVVYNLFDVIHEKCTLEQAVIPSETWPGLFLLSTPQTLDKTAVTPEEMKALTECCKEKYDYVILDCPAGIERGFQNSISGADRGIIVTVPEVPSVRDADRVRSLMEEQGIKENALIINRVRMHLIEQGAMMSRQEIEDMMPIPVIGIIPDDDAVIVASGKGTPAVLGNSLGALAYQKICRRVMGEEESFLVLPAKQEKLSWKERRRQKKLNKKRQ